MGGNVLEEAKSRDHDWLKLGICSTDHSYQWNGRIR
jgi:hypothetical protein